MKMRTVFTTGMVCCALVAGLGCGGRKSEQFRREGDTHLRLGQVEEAAGAYERALEMNPENAKAVIGQGHVHAVREEWAEALASFRSAIELDPAAEPAYLEATRLLVQLRRLDEALDVASDFAELAPETGGMLVAYVHREARRPSEAVRVLETLRDERPQSVPVRVDLALSYLAAGDEDAAMAELDTVLTDIDPESVPARMAFIDVCNATGRAGEAAREFRALAQENPDSLALQLGLARSLLAAGEHEEALELARQLYEGTPDSPWTQQVLGAGLLAAGRRSEALPLLERASEALPGNSTVMALLARARGVGSAPAPAPATAPSRPAPTVAAEEDPPDWRTLWPKAKLGQLLAARDEYLEEGGRDAAETIALCAFFAGDRAARQDALSRLPEDSPLHQYFDLLGQGRPGEFLAFMETWEETEEPRAVLRANALGVGMAALGGRARAAQTLSMALQEYPDYPITLHNLAQVFRAAGMPEFAAHTAQRLVREAVDNIEAHGMLFTYLRQAGLNDEALQAAEATYSLFPYDPVAISSLAQAYMDSGDDELSQRVLQRSLDRDPGNPLMQSILARAYLHAGETAKALDLVRRIDPQAGAAADPQFHLTAAFAHAAAGEWDELARLGEEADMAGTRVLRAAAFADAGDRERALEVLSGQPPAAMAGRLLLAALGAPDVEVHEDDQPMVQALAANPSLFSRFALGVACSNAGLARLAYEAYTELYEKASAGPTLVTGLLLAVRGAVDPDERLAEATALVGAHPDYPEAWMALASVANSLEDVDAQEQALLGATERAPDNPVAWRQLAMFYDSNDLKSRAIPAYRRILELNPDDYVASNNLSYSLLMTGGNLSEALSLAERATEAAPMNPSILHTLALAQLRSGMREECRRNLERALELRPGDPTMLLDLSSLSMEEGRDEQARGLAALALRYADQLGLDFERREEAERLAAGLG